jgi:hypothetical protein
MLPLFLVYSVLPDNIRISAAIKVGCYHLISFDEGALKGFLTRLSQPSAED